MADQHLTLGEKILVLRRRRGWSQRQLGEAAQINPNTIARLERDEIPDPGGRLILRLARALQTSTDYLLGRCDDDPSEVWPTGIATAWWPAIPAGLVPAKLTPARV
jgi:transcriptional regulator with XRE-family HTH domain